MTIFKIAQQLEDARRDVATISRLLAAEKRVDELAASYAAAQEQVQREAEQRERDRLQAMIAGFTDIRVDCTSDTDVGLLTRSYKITYTRSVWDSMYAAQVPRTFTVQGFPALSPEAMLYLTHKHPERIPSEIMALAPGEPERAFYLYFQARRRGHL